ncbi:MAG: response regulator [Bacteroidales bacterium]|nr:response regulator [Bacteroidales bacterium]
MNSRLIRLQYIFFSHIFLIVSTHAQAELNNYRHLSTLNGLSGSSITDIVQDQEGYIWIATTDGLNRYDGRSVRVYRNLYKDSTSLCDNRINDLFVDSKGRIWIGTENNGLNLYDYTKDNFRHYKYEQEDNRTLTFRYVTSIDEDADGNVWVATLKGLNRYNQEKDGFDRMYRRTQYLINENTINKLKSEELPDSIADKLYHIQNEFFTSEEGFRKGIKDLLGSDNIEKYFNTIKNFAFTDYTGNILYEQIRVLEHDGKGNLWLGFERNGISYFNTKNNSYKDYNSGAFKNVIGSRIIKLICDNEQLWVCSEKGLSVLSIEPDTLIFKFQILVNNSALSFLPITKNTAWFGTDKGAVKLTVANNEVNEEYIREPDVLRNSRITSLCSDMQNILWLGTGNNGVFFSQPNDGIHLFSSESFDKYTIGEKDISYIIINSENTFWIAYESGNIELWNEKKLIHQNSFTEWFCRNKKEYGIIRKIFEDSSHVFWIGTSKGRLLRYNSSDKSIKEFPFNKVTNISEYGIYDIDEDRNGDIWISIFGGGLVRISSTSDEMSYYSADPVNWQNSLANDWIYSLYTDSLGYLLVGSVDGFSITHIDTMQFVTYSALMPGFNKPSHNSIFYISGDDKGNYWLATANGLNTFNIYSGKFTLLKENIELPNSHIKGIVYQDKDLWISTNYGISRLILSKDSGLLQLINYEISIGKLQRDWLKRGICGITDNGKVFFGGKEGFVLINPDEISENTVKPAIIINQVSLLNQILKPEIWRSNNNQKKLIVKHNENVITLGFCAINYIQSEKNQYAYLMQGFDTDWQYVGTKSEATYTNLPPGRYTFRVIGANNDGYWNREGDMITIEVLPPFWKSNWALFAYVIIVSLFILGIARIFIVRQMLKTKIRIKEAEAQLDHESNALKLRFFTNISHEFRTPLTLMLAPIEKLINLSHKIETEERKFYYKLIYNNAIKLRKLIDQLMDFRKLENKSFKIEKKHGELIGFLKSIYDQFTHEASRREIRYHFNTDCKELYTDFDADVIDKILVNLISNAFKYTGDKSNIEIMVSVTSPKASSSDTKNLIINVKDNGIGIPAEKQDEIFTRFYQIKFKESIGTEIGLAFTKELVELLGGAISLESELNKGSCFTVEIPLSQGQKYISETIQETDFEYSANDLLVTHTEYDKNKPTVLLVDDTPDILNFLEKELVSDYNIIKATDGKSGILQAQNHSPDLIISDIMMPILDGIEMTKLLKKEKATSHIPIVLLTAKSSEEDEIEGLSLGIEGYIKKPFNTDILKMKISNIFKNRKLLHDNFKKTYEYIPEGITKNRRDLEFIETATNLVLNNLTNKELNSHFLENKLAVSKTVLYTKLKSLTGQSVNEFIRVLRLKKALELIKKGDNNLSAIGYDVGFSSLSYFTRSFSKHFGKPPSEFIK